MGLNSRGRGTAVVSAAVAALIAGGGTLAIAGQGSTTLSACVHHHGGGLYEAKTCARHDRRLTWGITGPAGPAGAAGATGPAGASGPAGKNGTDGTNGTNGIGAIELPFSTPVIGTQFEIGTLGSAAELDGVCADSAGRIRFGVVVSPSVLGAVQYSGSYQVYDTVAAGGLAWLGSASAPSYTWAISYSASTAFAHLLLEDGASTSATALFTGSVNIAVGGGTSAAADYELAFNIYTVPGSPDSCEGEVTAYPATP
jgi:hypothetical protein